MPTDRYDGVWVDEMDGPERLERAKKRRAEQLKRWEVREGSASGEPKSKKKHQMTLQFTPNIVMLEAAARNDLGEVAKLLDSGVSPDLPNEDGLTALHQALVHILHSPIYLHQKCRDLTSLNSCIDGCDDMVQYLLDHKADVNACDNELWTPLHAAAACGHLSIIELLIKNGGNIMALNLDGNLPAGVVDDNEEVEEYLDKAMLKLGYDEAAIEELRLNEGKQLLQDLKDSIAKGRSLDIQDETGATAFHVAAANGWTNVINFLLENEADFEVTDDDGWQPIHAAAAWGHDTVLEILVASGADLDSKTNDSRTPLDLTEETEIIELIEELKTKQVKYPRKGKGVRRKRSNTSNSSIKRTSIHEKSELSHADTKAEGAALFLQLQNTDNADASSPVTDQCSQTCDGTSNSSREETNSSGYVSEGSNETKTEKDELIKTSEITVNIDEEKDSPKVEDKLKVETEENKTIRQSPVPKPPRLKAQNTARLDPQAYINFEIEPMEKADKANKDIEQKENVEPITDIKVQNDKPKTEHTINQLKTSSPENTTKDENTNQVDKNTTSTLPKLAATEKRKAPEPPDLTTKGKQKSEKKKDLKEEVQKVPTRSDVPSSEQPTMTAVSDSKDKLPARKDTARGLSFHRKTCCSVM